MKNPTFEEFITSRRMMTATQIEETFGYEMYSPIAHVYLRGYSIEIDEENNNLHLYLGNKEYCAEFSKLFLLEQVLWDDFVKYEEQLTTEEIEEDLHERSRQFMDSQGWPPLSLDEQDRATMTPEQIEQVDYLLRQFDKL